MIQHSNLEAGTPPRSKTATTPEEEMYSATVLAFESGSGSYDRAQILFLTAITMAEILCELEPKVFAGRKDKG